MTCIALNWKTEELAKYNRSDAGMMEKTEVVAVVFVLLIMLFSAWVLIRHSVTVNNNSYLMKDKLPEIVLKSQLLVYYTALPDSKNNQKCLPSL